MIHIYSCRKLVTRVNSMNLVGGMCISTNSPTTVTQVDTRINLAAGLVTRVLYEGISTK